MWRLPFFDVEKALEKRVESIFQQLDKNNDDKLTFDEFKDASRMDPTIMRALSVEQTHDKGFPFNNV